MIERWLFEMPFSFFSIALGIWLFAAGLPQRSRRVTCVSALALASLAGVALTSPALLLPSETLAAGVSGLIGAVRQALFWCIVVAMYLLAILLATRGGVWASAFCAAAGYTLQNLASSVADSVELVLGSGATEAVPLAPTVLIEVLSVALTYRVAWRLIAEPIRRHGLDAQGDRRMFVMLMAVFVSVIFFDTINKRLVDERVDLGLVLALKLVHAISCVFVLVVSYELLVNRRLRDEALEAQGTLLAEQRTYELFRENLDAINIKCHDIRHQIRRIGERAGDGRVSREVLEDIEHEVSIYDTLMHTGNDALDAILSEKGLACEQDGIAFRCMADGAAVGFMASTDIYSLFGNALDNAIEASRALERREDRSISLTTRAAAGLLLVHVENRFAGSLSLGSDGLPLSSKGDAVHHGFGMRSMRPTAERYDGTLVTRAEGDVFHLNIAIPMPEEAS